MSSRVLTLIACVLAVAGVAALIAIAWTDLAQEPAADAPSAPPRLVVRETAVPESERKPHGPLRVRTIEYVRGSTSTVVVRDEVFTDEVDPALLASGRKPLEILDSLLSPERGVVLYQQNLSVSAGIFNPADGRRARVCRLTVCGPPREIQSARLVEDAQGLRAEIVRETDGPTDVYEITMGQGKLECRRRPNTE